MAEAPHAGSVTAAVVGVSAFAPHLELFCGELGFEIAAQGVVDAADAARLWGEGTGAVETVLLAVPGAPTGRVHLLKVAAPHPPAERPHTLDLGLGGLNLYAMDIEAAHDRLVAAGHPWLSRPQTYEVPLGARVVSVTEGVCHGPDGMELVFVQPAEARGTHAWRAEPRPPYTELTSVVAKVPDIEAELAFWAALGLTAAYDITFSSPGLEEMAGLPPGTRVRLAFVTGEGGGTTRIELIRSDGAAGGVDRRPAQRPGRALGHTGWSVMTADVEATVSAAARSGGIVRRAPFEADTPLHGRARLAALDTPNGIAVEFWQPRD